ncbi:calcium-binding protein [Ahrensia sp. R2A130]|uniref:calcium-binding protein n=1 Tax=Ahrensia sp. R2A130 TaxID=744979 RepID=UPI0001E0D0C4|nr:calcium-binding protein [Ahrensia sp. R2A130]EFL90869.1 hemolysin-type calcium-binding region [Ahrensia sp. R2A130]
MSFYYWHTLVVDDLAGPFDGRDTKIHTDTNKNPDWSDMSISTNIGSSSVTFDEAEFSGNISHLLNNRTDSYGEYVASFRDTVVFDTLSSDTDSVGLRFSGTLSGGEGNSLYGRDLSASNWHTVTTTVSATNVFTGVRYFESFEWEYGVTNSIILDIPIFGRLEAYDVSYSIRVDKDSSGWLSFDYDVDIAQPETVVVSSSSGLHADSTDIENIIVLTHGWQPYLLSRPDEIEGLATLRDALEARLEAEGVRDNTLIVEYKWPDSVTPLNFLAYGEARDATYNAGLQLSSSLGSLIGVIDSKDEERASPNVHFIGHSLGTLVNAFAAQSLSSTDYVQQVTILDSPLDPAKFFNSSELAALVDGGLSGADAIPHEPFFWTYMNSSNIGYVDNYYGDQTSLIFKAADNYGQPIVGTGPIVGEGGVVFPGANHGEVVDEYAEIVRNGDWHSPAIGNLSIPQAWNPQSVFEILDIERGGEEADVLVGDDTQNWILGYDGSDSLIGGLDADRMFGGRGDDYYQVENIADVVVELAGEGDDIIDTFVSYDVPVNVEVLRMQGTDDLATNGSVNRDIIQGNSGDNYINGAGGLDVMIGGDGNDTYTIDDSQDAVVEAVGGGDDVIYSSVDYLMNPDQEIETAILTENAVTLRGDDSDNQLFGNDLVNVLEGKGGTDYLLGLGGDDIFQVSKEANATDLDVFGDFEGAGVIGGDRIALDAAQWGMDGIVTQLSQTSFEVSRADGTNGQQFIIANLEQGNNGLLMGDDYYFG